MQINSEPSKNNYNRISTSFQKLISALVADVMLHEGNLETRMQLLKIYCENENLSFAELKMNLNLFFELLEDYHKKKEPILFRFLKIQAQFCFIDETELDFLLKAPTEHEYIEIQTPAHHSSQTTNSSGNNAGIVGGHLIGL